MPFRDSPTRTPPASPSRGWLGVLVGVVLFGALLSGCGGHREVDYFGLTSSGRVALFDAELRQIRTLRTGRARAPDLSPDGRTVVFEKHTSVPEECCSGCTSACVSSDAVAIWSAPTDGAAAVRLGDEAITNPSFSPSGKRLAFNGQFGIVIRTLATGHDTRLSGVEGQLLTWSPDGKHLAVVPTEGGVPPPLAGAGVEVVGLDGRVVATLPSALGVPVWSPDGRQLAFAEGVEEPLPRHLRTIVYDLASGRRRAVIGFECGQCGPSAWSDDGLLLKVPGGGYLETKVQYRLMTDPKAEPATILSCRRKSGCPKIVGAA